MSLAKKHVLEFSPYGGKLFTLIDEQGILRIWDTETNLLKQEYTPNFHLTGPCNALTWVTVAAPSKKPSMKSPKIQAAEEDKLYIALGTFKGTVSLYSLAEGKIERTLRGEGHDGLVKSIVYDKAGLLYTVGQDCRVLVWSLAEERCINSWDVGPEKPHNLVYLPQSRAIAVGSRQIKIYDIDTKELLETFTGHTTEINTMTSCATVGGDEYVITTAKMERVICFWKIEKNGRNKSSTCTLLMEDLAYSVAIEVRTDEQIRIASVTRNGNIHIYLLNEDSLSVSKFIKPKVSLQIASDGADIVEPIHAIAAHFVHDANRSHEILFGYGSRSILRFERFTPNYAEKLNVIVRTDPKKLVTKTQRKKKANTETTLKTPEPIIHKKLVEYNSALPVSKKKVQNEVPLEARLETLKIPGSAGEGEVRAESKTQLLMQALHSNDQTLLAAVLKNNIVKIIKLTLERLPLEYVNPLIYELSRLMQGKHRDVACALRWLKVLVSTHTSVLMSEDREELREKLGVCLGVAEQRLHCLTEALQVTGRVNLIINQMGRNLNTHLNDRNALIVNDEVNDTPPTAIDDSDIEKNWSDLEEHNSNGNDAVSDEDMAVDDDNIALTQDSDNSDDDDKDSDQVSNTDSDESPA
ncbi:WD repeat-containing protein 43 [Scaptodrosophila lebanonensis]|uniref:WD repeat-containing protein 43 n=1 Tax=Drosophila lebanonensis TaxID=7225 RepID=A0A6J2UKU4_DROLE|nr:WD repeat-containing protein 43 [Scaptodrosophila lebanonensis]